MGSSDVIPGPVLPSQSSVNMGTYKQVAVFSFTYGSIGLFFKMGGTHRHLCHSTTVFLRKREHAEGKGNTFGHHPQVRCVRHVHHSGLGGVKLDSFSDWADYLVLDLQQVLQSLAGVPSKR